MNSTRQGSSAGRQPHTQSRERHEKLQSSSPNMRGQFPMHMCYVHPSPCTPSGILYRRMGRGVFSFSCFGKHMSSDFLMRNFRKVVYKHTSVLTKKKWVLTGLFTSIWNATTNQGWKQVGVFQSCTFMIRSHDVY